MQYNIISKATQKRETSKTQSQGNNQNKVELSEV